MSRKCQKAEAALTEGCVAVRAERRGEGSGMGDSSVRWMTDVTRCSSSCQQTRRQRRRMKRRGRRRRAISQNVTDDAVDRTSTATFL